MEPERFKQRKDCRMEHKKNHPEDASQAQPCHAQAKEASKQHTLHQSTCEHPGQPPGGALEYSMSSFVACSLQELEICK
jgi:hypothetical protein